jgi:hypothetical protein
MTTPVTRITDASELDDKSAYPAEAPGLQPQTVLASLGRYARVVLRTLAEVLHGHLAARGHKMQA